MSTQLIPLDVISDEVTRRALFGFLARYRGDTLRAYQQDLKAYLTWCRQHDLAPLLAQRPHLELYLRWMEQRGYAAATIGRRFATVAGFYRYAVIDGHLPVDPTLAVTRPAVPWEGQRRTVLPPLELIAGVPLRDMQYAMRHADARTTTRYDMARANLDRHAAHAVAAYLAGMASG